MDVRSRLPGPGALLQPPVLWPLHPCAQSPSCLHQPRGVHRLHTPRHHTRHKQVSAASDDGHTASSCAPGGVSLSRRVMMTSCSILFMGQAAAPAGMLPRAWALPGLPAASPYDWLAGAPGSASIPNPGLSWALTNAGRQLNYPEWMAGTWSVTGRFKGAGFPQGQRFISREVPGVTKASMIAALADVGAGMDGPVSWQLRFIQAGGNVVADRPFNLSQQVNAFLGYGAVRRVEYEPQKNPTRLSVVYATPRRGTPTTGPPGDADLGTAQGSSDLRKAELFVNNRGSLLGAPPVGPGLSGSTTAQGSECIVWELYRQVTQAARQGGVGDYMTIMHLRADDRGAGEEEVTRVTADVRVAAFLEPQDALFFESGGRAVAVYDYVWDMTRVP